MSVSMVPSSSLNSFSGVVPIERADAQQMLILVLAGEMQARIEQDEFLGGHAALVGEAAEHAPGSFIVRGDGGFDVAHIRGFVALQQGGQHTLGQTPAPRFLMHRYLPYEQGVLLLGRK